MTLLNSLFNKFVFLGWKFHSDSYGVSTYINDMVPGAQQIISIWSVNGKGINIQFSDTVQIEISVRLHDLENFIAENLGDEYINEMGRTVSIFLHRLIPNGRRFAQGFQLVEESSSENKSCLELVEYLSLYGIPFANNFANGDILLNDESIDSKILDLMKWEVRKVLYTLANQPDSEPKRLLNVGAMRLKNELRINFYAISKFIRSMDPDLEVTKRLDSFARFSERVLKDPCFVAAVRSRIHRRS